MKPNRPKAPLPEPMTAMESDTWAGKTVRIRFGDTARRVLDENEFPKQIASRLEELIQEIPEAAIRPLDDPGAPDLEAWNVNLEPYLGMNWLEPPWFVSEHYFYRRILEAIGFFQAGQGQRYEPFLVSKQRGLEQGFDDIVRLAHLESDWLQVDRLPRESVLPVIYMDLWGNQADYSLWPADDGSKPDHADLSQADDFLLVDSGTQVADYILSLHGKNPRIDFLIDNAGLELVNDLVFADLLLTAGAAKQVYFHLKAHPTFVSDALPKDVNMTVEFFQTSTDPIVQALGLRLFEHINNTRLNLRSDFFWNSPLDGWEIPEALIEVISGSDLVISKGDANYRRLLGDRHWSFTTPFDQIINYFPVPLVALRTLKSELVCGLEPGQVEAIAAEDPEWMVNGRWGLIQFYFP
jgi:hypothetical protein